MSRSHTPLTDLVTRDLVTINPQDTLREALAVMVENRISALPVVDARQRCVGVLSVTDLLGVTRDLSDELNALSETGGLDHESLVQKLERADLLTEAVRDWMSPEPICIGLESTVAHAARLMLKNQVHRLFVLDSHERVAGVVSTMDLLAALTGEEQ